MRRTSTNKNGMDKRTELLLLALVLHTAVMQAQHSLDFYIDHARSNSPLLMELRNSKEKSSLELTRLKAACTGMRMQADGDFIFVPVVSRDNGRTRLVWNSPSPTEYFGYDTGQASSELRAAVTLSKPLNGGARLRAEQARTRIAGMQADNDIMLNEHEIERAVTDLYLLCLLDGELTDCLDSTEALVRRQRQVMERMAEHGLCGAADLRLLDIEMLNVSSKAAEARTAFNAHVADLNILCGVTDTVVARLSDVELALRPAVDGGGSRFTEKYRLDSMAVMARLDTWKMQYRPQVSLFADGGVNTSDVNRTFRRFGASAGITFSWLLFDGRQRRNMERQAALDISTNRAYRDNMMLRREQMRRKYMRQIYESGQRTAVLGRQADEYRRLLESYLRLMQHGGVSVTTYITVMRNSLQTAYELLALRTDIKLMVNALNYWNW